jgi:hypothetical protein
MPTLKAPSFSRLLKKTFGPPLPHGRGSVNSCKHGIAILSRAREQAGFSVFQQPVRSPMISLYSRDRAWLC